MKKDWRVVCDDSVNDFESELKEQVAADFIFDMPFGRTSRVRVFFVSGNGKPYVEFKELMFARLAEVLEPYSAEEIWQMLAEHLNKNGVLYRQKPEKRGRKPHNPYASVEPSAEESSDDPF